MRLWEWLVSSACRWLVTFVTLEELILFLTFVTGVFFGHCLCILVSGFMLLFFVVGVAASCACFVCCGGC